MLVKGACMVPLFAAAMGGDVAPPRVAVLDVEIDEEPGANLQQALLAAVVRALEQAGHSSVVAGEACADPSCMRAVAERLDASHVVRVGVSVAGTDYMFALELIEAKTGQLVGQLEGTCEICTYQEAAEAVYEQARGFELAQEEEEEEEPPARVPSIVTSDPAGATVHVARYRPGPAGYAGWAVAVTGLATLAGGIALIAINEREVESNCSGEHVDAAGNCEFRYDTLAGGVTMTVLGAVGVGGGAGLVVWDHKRKGTKVTASLGVGGVGLQGRF